MIWNVPKTGQAVAIRWNAQYTSHGELKGTRRISSYRIVVLDRNYYIWKTQGVLTLGYVTSRAHPRTLIYITSYLVNGIIMNIAQLVILRGYVYATFFTQNKKCDHYSQNEEMGLRHTLLRKYRNRCVLELEKYPHAIIKRGVSPRNFNMGVPFPWSMCSSFFLSS